MPFGDGIGYQGGRQRGKKNRFLEKTRAAQVPKAEQKWLEANKVDQTVNAKGKKVGGHEIAHRGFLVKEHEKKVIKHLSPGYGKGRGHGHHKKGYHLSAATRRKISEALKGRHHSHKGHVMSTATRSKISASLKKYDKSHPAAVKARAVKAAATRKARGEKPYAKRGAK